MKYAVIALICAGLGALAAIVYLERGMSEADIRQACSNVGANEAASGRALGMPEQTARAFGEHARLKCMSREGLKG